MVPPTQRSSSRGGAAACLRMIADPFGDITRQYQAQTLRPVMNVTAITRRSDAILQDVFAASRSPSPWARSPRRGRSTTRCASGSATSSPPFTCRTRLRSPLLRLHQEEQGQGKAVALAAIQESRTFQTVVVVDDVIDVFDEADVVRAALVNVDPSRDIDVIHNIPNVFTTSIGSAKVPIDATRPHDRTIPPMNRAPRTRWTGSTSTTTSTRCTGAISTPTSRTSRWNGRPR